VSALISCSGIGCWSAGDRPMQQKQSAKQHTKALLGCLTMPLIAVFL